MFIQLTWTNVYGIEKNQLAGFLVAKIFFFFIGNVESPTLVEHGPIEVNIYGGTFLLL